MHLRKCFSKAFIALFMLPALTAVSAPAANADWTMYLKNESRLPVVDKAPQPPLALKWRFRTGGQVYSTPLVYKGKVYFGSYDKNFYAVDAATGAVAWKFATNGEIFSTGAISDGKVYFGSRDGLVYALDADTGKLAWKYETEGPVLTSPVVAEGLVLIGSKDLFIYGLDARTGQKVWRSKLPDYEKYSGIYASPAYYDGAVIYAGKNGILYSSAAKSGGRNWSLRTDSAIYSSPVIKDGVIYISSYSRVLYAVNAKTGKAVWRKNLENDLVYASAAVTQDAVYVVFKNGAIKAFNKTDGKDTTILKLPDEINSTPVVAGNGTMFVGCDDGGIYAVDLASRSVAWKYMTEGSVQSSPSVVEDAVFVGSEDGSVYAFQRQK